jgi:hypothetical protein
VKTFEDRLRDAYRDAAETVTPDSIRQLGEHVHAVSPPRARPPRITRRFMIMPLAVASAVALVAVLTIVIVPRIVAGARSAGQTTRSPAGRFAVAVTGSGQHLTGAQTLTIFNAASGAGVATIATPRHGMYFAGAATGDGRHFVVELRRPHVCRTWLYQFRLNLAGRPTQLVRFQLPSTPQSLDSIAVSEDNRTFAYAGNGCTGNGRAAITVVHLTSMQSRRWAVPSRTHVGSLSLTADGRLLAYDITLANLPGSAAYVLPTNSPPGRAAARASAVASSKRLGVAGAIKSAVITPSGSAVYYTVVSTRDPFSARWQLRVAELPTGGTHVVGSYPGFPPVLRANPAVNKALVAIEQVRKTPMPSASDLNSPTPSPSPSGPSFATPSPSPSGPSLATPSPSPSGAQNDLGSLLFLRPVVRLVLVDLRTGSTTRVYARWNPATTIFNW